MLRMFAVCISQLSHVLDIAIPYSDYFHIAVGLSQGVILTPVMFSLFVEDLELYLQKRHGCSILLQDLCLLVLLFADDMVVICETPDDLQLSLNRLQDYCNAWCLDVFIILVLP